MLGCRVWYFPRHSELRHSRGNVDDGSTAGIATSVSTQVDDERVLCLHPLGYRSYDQKHPLGIDCEYAVIIIWISLVEGHVCSSINLEPCYG
jgi:hypothetical protein